jgi:hypothetical protein
LEELFVYAGYGKNGWRIPSHGSAPNFRAVMLTASFSMPQSKLHWVMAQKQVSGTITGWMVKLQDT